MYLYLGEGKGDQNKAPQNLVQKLNENFSSVVYPTVFTTSCVLLVLLYFYCFYSVLHSTAGITETLRPG